MTKSKVSKFKSKAESLKNYCRKNGYDNSYL